MTGERTLAYCLWFCKSGTRGHKATDELCTLLPFSISSNFPTQETGKYFQLENISVLKIVNP